MNAPNSDAKRGIIYTFYSFKGGAGRTMALANVAALLSKWGRRVLIVDWDLEAPGVERFFASHNQDAKRLRSSYPGITDLMLSRVGGAKLSWRDCSVQISPGLFIIGAGRDDGEYVKRVQGLNFEELFGKYDLGTFIEHLRSEWISEFEFVLIDSRTGITDIGGICTVHLPDVLVLFFTANDSSTEGALDIFRRAMSAQERLPLDRGRLIAVPVPSRDESRTEYESALRWKGIFAERFHDVYSDWLPKAFKPRDAVELLRIPYIPHWSFGEQLPVLVEETSDPGSLSYAYEVLARLLSTRLDWYQALEGRALAPPPSIRPRRINNRWLQKNRVSAMSGFTRSGKQGFMELYHFCIDALVEKDQAELVGIADQASIHTFGWPIGAVLRNREDLRPRPTNDGIVADMNTDHDYDYWTLNRLGDFYSLMSLFEDDRAEKVLFFDTRIVRTTEAVLHCINIYKGFGIEPTASISLTIRYVGLKGRHLTVASPNRRPFFPGQNSVEDEVAVSKSFRVGIGPTEITKVVKSLCEPVFVLFDFARFPDETYERLVTDFIDGKIR
jgi:cellulose biosynthesis protein BcsQ